MNILDANIPMEQRDLLQLANIPCREIGLDLAEANIGDDNIITLLRS